VRRSPEVSSQELRIRRDWPDYITNARHRNLFIAHQDGCVQLESCESLLKIVTRLSQPRSVRLAKYKGEQRELNPRPPDPQSTAYVTPFNSGKHKQMKIQHFCNRA
jgi:hypothetical protein